MHVWNGMEGLSSFAKPWLREVRSVFFHLILKQIQAGRLYWFLKRDVQLREEELLAQRS